jgi:formylglycine-generating enzyme required for sulfatase activity
LLKIKFLFFLYNINYFFALTLLLNHTNYYMIRNYIMRKFFTILLLSPGMVLFANDISVSNVQLVGQNTTMGANDAANYSLVQFDLSWQNSWRSNEGPANWDAAWVFVKYRVGSGDWQHALLNNTGHTAPAGSSIDVGLQTPGSAFNATTNAGIGAFVYHSANGSGTFSLSNVQLRWNYGANGVQDAAVVDVRVFAIEMVYIPQGSFSVGDGTTTSVQGQFRNGSTNTPFTISAETALTLGRSFGTDGNLANNNASGMFPRDDFDNTTTKTLPDEFPKGFNAFYGMKYEISQQGYVDFLNTLTRAQQDTRTGTPLASGTTSVTNRYVMSNSSTLQRRNGIRCDGTIDGTAPITFYCDLNDNGTGGELADGQWLACNYLSFMDVAAYLDWSGLRPMTELEFEKACRGTLTPVAGEYAWGSTSITGAENITSGGTVSETTNTENANAVYNNNGNVQGPMRVGVFATGSSTREQSGAGYYGMMELSGNLWECPVTVGNATGRAFTGVHGNGGLSANGNANETAWPGISSGEVSGATGAGFRGGVWAGSAIRLRTSARIFAASTVPTRNNDHGGRGVRVAP